MNKVAILYICTGKYVVFWEDFYKSFQKNFLPVSDKEYFVFTDKDNIYDENSDKVHRICQENMGWPGTTLFRFRMFNSIQERLKDFDYVFFINANIVCEKKVDEVDFLPIEEDLLVVQHPGFYDTVNYRYPYERNRKSLAYIPYGEGKYYICGGVNGGKTNAYLKLISCLQERVDTDYAKGIIAKWHDESQINKYILENDNYRILTPSFCYPEEAELPFEPIFIVRNKSKIFDVEQVKGKTQKSNVLMYIGGYIHNIYLDVRYGIFNKGE